MRKMRNFNLFYCFLFFKEIILAQNFIQGNVYSNIDSFPIENVLLFDSNSNFISKTDKNGYFIFNLIENNKLIYFQSDNYLIEKIKFNIRDSLNYSIFLKRRSYEIDQINLELTTKFDFNIRKLYDVENMIISLGKKSEVILISDFNPGTPTNNPRQIFNQIPGLNIFENDEAGLQLNIGVRGLSPSRSSNFNTRQNNYEISADPLGYPESYYTPPLEALSEIQIIRGAGALQYGSQFGGMINFIFKNPTINKKFDLVSRNSYGSNNLFTNFLSISGGKEKFQYYIFNNYKIGDGFRDNSGFESNNFFTKFIYSFNNKTKLSSEITLFNYLSQQAGGVSDYMFANDPFQSIRERNWFGVNWLIINSSFKKEINNKISLEINFSRLVAQRNAIGFRSNRVDQFDSNEERDLIKGNFKNFSLESKLIKRYKLKNNNALFLIGGKYFKSNNFTKQGPGSEGYGADFRFFTNEFPYYPNQSSYRYPNLNYSFFLENIFYINDKFSIIPGFRYENIKTESIGKYKNIILDAANNVIYDETVFNNEQNLRNFLLSGIGISYKLNKIDFYFNVTQNYRSVTFNDMSVVNPSFIIDPNLKDESGRSIDFGVRKNINNILSYDISVFMINYNDRIGFIQTTFDDYTIKNKKTNVGNALIKGIESNIQLDIKNFLNFDNKYTFTIFSNYSNIDSKYKKSPVNGITGNSLEFVPKNIFRTGSTLGYKSIFLTVNFSYVSSQFTDATNSIESNLSGVVGLIPNYSVMDISICKNFGKFKILYALNNVLDNYYFTNRASGYPGPGIIPSINRNSMLNFQYNF